MRRRGNVLAVVLVGIVLAAILGFALVRLSMRSSRTGAWSRDHLVLRLLAESAVEEAFFHLGEMANKPGTPVFRLLRTLPAKGAELPIEILKPGAPALQEDLQQRRELAAGTVTLDFLGAARKLVSTSDDAMERAGLVRIGCTARLASGSARVTERFRAERAFRIARVMPGPPLDSVGLFVALPAQSGLRNVKPGQPAFATGDGPPRTLLDTLTKPPPEGLQAVDKSRLPSLARAVRGLTPAALATKAHYVTRDGAELGRFVSSRLDAGLPLSGVIHNLSREMLRLSFPSFRGKCLISSAGPIQLGEVGLEDPDCEVLTLVAGERLVVDGRSVKAVLVQLGDRREGVVFAQRAEVFGSLLTTAFPMGQGLGEQALGACRIEHNPALSAGRRAGVGSDPALAAYVVAFSPYWVSVEHARENEEWSKW